MEATVAWLHFQRHFGIFVDFSERAAVVGLEHRQQGHIHALQNGCHRHPDVAEPHEHVNRPPVAALLFESRSLLQSHAPHETLWIIGPTLRDATGAQSIPAMGSTDLLLTNDCQPEGAYTPMECRRRWERQFSFLPDRDQIEE